MVEESNTIRIEDLEYSYKGQDGQMRKALKDFGLI